MISISQKESSPTAAERSQSRSFVSMSDKTSNKERKVMKKNPPSAAAGVPMAESTKKPRNVSGFEDEILCRA
jgi:hypothetical protein